MIERQKSICKKYNAIFSYCADEDKLGIALQSLNQQPIHGVRVNREKDTCGWYIWGGEYSNNEDFYQPVHYKHVREILPEYVIQFLGLSVGFRFMCDHQGYEDVWRE